MTEVFFGATYRPPFVFRLFFCNTHDTLNCTVALGQMRHLDFIWASRDQLLAIRESFRASIENIDQAFLPLAKGVVFRLFVRQVMAFAGVGIFGLKTISQASGVIQTAPPWAAVSRPLGPGKT